MAETRLNLIPAGAMPVVYANQYDFGIQRVFAIFKGSEVFGIPSGYSVSLRATKPDGYGVVVVGSYVVEDNKVTITIPEQLTAVAGKCICELVFLDAESVRAGTINFILAVEPAALSDNTVISDSDIAYGEELLDTWGSVTAIATNVVQNTEMISALDDALAEEGATREADDAAMEAALTSEISDRQNADAALADQISALQGAVGSPLVAATVADMTDTTRIYVYTGSETGYTAGDWYYYDGSAWTSGGAYNSQALSTDTTLSVAGMAADAKSAGDAVRNLYRAATGDLIQTTDLSAWESGRIRVTDSGANVSDPTRIRSSTYFKIGSIARFSVDAGYKLQVAVYSGKSYSTYLGIWDGVALAKVSAWQTGDFYLGNLNREYYYRLLLAFDDDSNITTAESVHLKAYTYTDAALTAEGVPADAKATGTAVRELQDAAIYGGKPAVVSSVGLHPWEIVSGGLWNAAHYSITLPVNPGDVLEITASSAHANSVGMLRTYNPISGEAADFSTATGWTTTVSVSAGATARFTVPADAHYVYSYAGPSANWIPSMYKIDGYDYAKTIFENVAALGDTLNEYNSVAIRAYHNNVSETTVNGITYSITDGVITLSGTSTAKTYITYEGSATSIPGWLENRSYYGKISKAAPDNVRVQLSAYKNGSYLKSFFFGQESGTFTVSGLAELSGVIVRLNIPKGETLDNTIGFAFLSAIPNTDIGIAEESAPVKVRMMQYNIGKFNMGRPLDGDYHFLTSANYDQVVTSYKALLGNAQPDIIGFEEFEDDVLVKGVDGAEDVTVSMDDVLFDRLYPYLDTITALGSKRAIKAKYPLKNSAHLRVEYSFEYGGETYSSHYYVVRSRIDIGGKSLAILVNAFPNTDDEQSDEWNLANREAAYQASVDILEDEEYAFIVCDANAGSVLTPTIMQDVLTPAGYEAAMGDYFPFQNTYLSPVSGNTGAIDNVFYKKAKVQLVNFHVLWDEKAGLASDHAPVYADFLIL